ncbi:MAG TPA: hypothetical protein VEB66_17435 [Opitutaceae bacterium]|nr:hypothetical protein [Opitutaceae bacterium]
MNPKFSLRFLLADVVTLAALAVSALGQGSMPAGRGLNGTNYLSPTYLYSRIDDGPPDAYHGFGLRYNQVLAPRFDLIVTGSVSRSERFAGSRARQTGFDAGVRWHTDIGSARPFVEATIGGTWFDFGGFEDNSFTYAAGLGAEFQVTGNFSLAPMIGYSDATDFPDSGDAFLVLRSNYWLNERWSIRVNVSIDEDGPGLGAGVAWAF